MATTAKPPRKNTGSAQLEFTRATLNDVSGIQAVLLANRKDDSLLQRSRADIQRNVPDFFVATDDRGRLMGCGAVHFHTPKIAEILTLAVMPGMQGMGIGGRLMEECRRIAEERGARTLWITATKPEYFARHGYRKISRFSLPRRVLWAKYRQFLQQTPSHWIPALLWRFTFMKKEL